MGRVLLHAGMHKTGTSSIQASLSSGLSDPDFIYLDLGEPNHSGPLINLFGEMPERYHGNRKRGLTTQDLQRIRQDLKFRFDNELKSLGERTAIISAEDACKFSKKELNLLRDAIAKNGHSMEVVIYLRPPRGYIESAFQQLIKGGQSSFKLENAYPNYRNLILFSEIFGKVNCSYRLFSRPHLYQEDVLLDLLHKLKPGLVPVNQIVVNEGISLTALKFLYAYRKYGPGYGADKDAIRRNNGLVGRLARLEGDKLSLGPKLTDKYFQSCKCDLEIVASLLDPNVYQLFLEDVMPVEANVNCEGDLLQYSPKEVEDLVALSRKLKITIPSDYESYSTPQAVAKIVACLIPGGDHPMRVEDIPTVIKGKEGFLFLAGGRHSPYAYAKGQLHVDPKSIQTFWRNIRLRQDQMLKRGVSYLHLVVPDKHNICKDVFPDPISVTLASVYLSACPTNSPDLAKNVVFPLEDLRTQFREVCSRVDTHLEPLGLILCIKALNSQFHNLETSQLYPVHQSCDPADRLLSRLVVTDEAWAGDLGSKLDPAQTEPRRRLAVGRSVQFFSNRFAGGNNGICDLYFNLEQLGSGARVMVFGDSFGRALAGIIAPLVAEVFFFRTPFLHVDLVNQIRPTHVITQNVERYLSNVVPDQERSCFWLYPHLKDQPYHPPLGFIHAMNAVTAADGPLYNRFINGLRSNATPDGVT